MCTASLAIFCTRIDGVIGRLEMLLAIFAAAAPFWSLVRSNYASLIPSASAPPAERNPYQRACDQPAPAKLGTRESMTCPASLR